MITISSCRQWAHLFSVAAFAAGLASVHALLPELGGLPYLW